MPRIEDQHKQEIKQQIWLKIQQNQGIRTAEIADQLKLDRRRVQNYLAELRDEGKIEQEGWGWLSLEFRGPRLYRFELSPEEVITLYLGARLLVKQHDQRNEPAETALRKLATVLRSDAPIGQEIERAADELAQREEDHEYQSIFRKIAQAYAYRKKLKLVYKPPGSNPFPTVFSVYLIEPSLVGAATYIIGHSSNVDAVREYKLGRIQSAELTDENCTIPPEYQGLEVMRHAWSVIGGEAKIEVVLRFSPKVRERVLETRWHPSQETKDDPEKTGWLRWQVKVPSTLDMLPWIRGWGADCEVVGPEGLREKLETEAKRLMHRYNIASPKTTEPQQRLLRCWGKTGKHELDFHPALFHMLDVGHTAYHLLSAPASPRWRKALVRAFNTDDETLVYWLPWLIALHDIGKISVPFQAQNASQKARLEREGFEFGAWKPKDKIHHTDMGRLFLKYEYDEADLPPWPQRNWLRRAWLEMVGGHHGTFPGLRQEGDSLSRSRKHMRSLQVPEEWAQLRQRADQLLRTFFLSATPVQWPEPQNVSVAIMALTGFTILCDWLGSDERYFMPHSDTDLLDYVAHSRQQAREAVTKAGFFQPSQSTAPAKFEELFPDRTPPRPLQQAIDEIPEEILQQPCLAIIEAPTGEGKTEAALALAHRVAQHSGTDALYCALPTMATSNQMFKRVQTHLYQRLGLPTQAKLVHGQAFLMEDDLRLKPLGDAEKGPHPSLEWFGPKKKALLAPFGVGTVDQAELAALNVRHNALRLIGLAGKVVILDEVHAYDTYMTTIIEQMLRWLSALGSTVILLSATLPQSRRTALAKAYGAPFETCSDQERDYPSLWIGGQNGSHHALPEAYKLQQVFQLKHLHIPHEDAAEKARWLLNAVAEGGCACWITNTVDRAQKLYEAVTQADPTLTAYLLHARFPLEERQKLEEDITTLFGPGGARPQRSVVIGTQVLEQSLDLDFDVMVSDLAPIDLLLQRMGRVHRHDNSRPEAHQVPTLWVNSEPDLADDNRVLMGADRFYHEYILQKTWQAITGKNVIRLPDYYRPLVEAVYAPGVPDAGDPMQEAWDKLQKHETLARGKARQYLLPAPDPRRPFCYSSQVTFEEDDNSAAWFVAQTRLGAESVTILPLVREGDKARLYPLDEWVDLTTAPARQTALRLLRRTLRLSQYNAVAYFREQGSPTETLFQDSSLLKSIYPLWLKNGATEIPAGERTIKLTLDPDLGLVIDKS